MLTSNLQTTGVYINELDALKGSFHINDRHINIHIALIASELNTDLKSLFSLNEDIVTVSSLVCIDGSIPLHVSNKVVLQVVNIQQLEIDSAKELIKAKNVCSKSKSLSLLVSANFDPLNYLESLKMIDAVADFFLFTCPQGKAKYMNSSIPLTINPMDLNLSELTKIFTMLGTRYIPSLTYQVIIPPLRGKFSEVNDSLAVFNAETTKKEIKDELNSVLQQFVFEPNTYATWLAIKYLADEYLFSLWKAGKLIGKTPDDAYIVNIGLGSSMSAQDILNGDLILNVFVLLDDSDFIELLFKIQLAAA